MDTFGEYAFQVRSYECGPDGYATLATICNYLQEAASLNAESLKFSKSKGQDVAVSEVGGCRKRPDVSAWRSSNHGLARFRDQGG